MKTALTTIAILVCFAANAQLIKPIKSKSPEALKSRGIETAIATAIVGTVSGTAVAATYFNQFDVDANLRNFLFIPATIGTVATIITGYSSYRNLYFYHKKKPQKNMSLIVTPLGGTVALTF